MRVPKILFLLGTGFIFASASLINAGVPQMINYQGKITRPTGALVDTSVQMIFTIYDDSTTGNTLWADTLGSVSVEKGIFNVLLGSNNPIPDSVFDGNIRYLGVKVGSDTEMTPRKAMVSVAYAYRAGTADGGNGGGGGGWVDDGSVVRLETSTDYVGMGTTTPDRRLTIKGDTESTDACIHLDGFWNPEIFLDVGGYEADGKINFQKMETDRWTLYYDGSEDALKISQSGAGTLMNLNYNKVSIGANAPEDKLDVDGDIRVRGADIKDAGGTVRVTLSQNGRLDLNEEEGSTALSVDTTGNVGIGSTSPNSPLEVAGVVHSTSGGFKFPDGSTQTKAVDGHSLDAADGSPVDAVYVDNDGKVGMGTTSPTGELEVKKDQPSGTCIKINNAQAGESAGEWVYFYEDWEITSGIGHTNSSHTLGEMMEIATYRNIPMMFRINDIERMRIATDGNVGIGTTGPGDKLDVNGDIRVRGADIKDAGGTSRITLTDDGRLDLKEDGGSSALSIATNSYVGMGTTSPDKRLTLTGNTDTTDACMHLDAFWNPEIFFDAGASTADGKIHFQTSGTEKWTFYHDGSENSIKFNKNGTGTILYLASSGNVGIGVTSPLDKLDVNGTARLRGMSSSSGTDVVVDGNGTLYRKSSSRKYKENIERLNSDPHSVFELTPVRFEWKTTGAKDIGLVAEDVVKSVPDLVILDNEGKPDAVKYDRLTLYLLELAKNQQEKISELEKRIDELEKLK